MNINRDKLAIDGGTPVRTEGFPTWPIFGDVEEKLILEVVRSGKWGGTGEVLFPEFQAKLPEFEKKFAELQNAAYAVSVVNGTVAITIALQAAGIKPGDEVIVPPYSFIATASAALAYGVIPVFVDIEEDTLMIDPEKIEQAITPNTKAIIAVHLSGAPANLTRLKEIAEKHQLKLIEDAAQAVGAQWEGEGVGAIGDLGTFSFQSSKNLNAGEGGIVLTNDRELWDKAWSYHNVGRVQGGGWYQHELLGQNYRMTEFQAAILLAQMTRLDAQMELRERNAKLLNSLIADTDGVCIMKEDSRITRHGRHFYICRIEAELADRIDKQNFILKLNAEGIPVSGGYVPLNQNKAIIRSTKDWTGNERQYSCPVAERAFEKVALSFPPKILISDEKAMYDVAAALKKVIRSY